MVAGPGAGVVGRAGAMMGMGLDGGTTEKPGSSTSGSILVTVTQVWARQGNQCSFLWQFCKFQTHPEGRLDAPTFYRKFREVGVRRGISGILRGPPTNFFAN